MRQGEHATSPAVDPQKPAGQNSAPQKGAEFPLDDARHLMFRTGGTVQFTYRLRILVWDGHHRRKMSLGAIGGRQGISPGKPSPHGDCLPPNRDCVLHAEIAFPQSGIAFSTRQGSVLPDRALFCQTGLCFPRHLNSVRCRRLDAVDRTFRR